MSGHLLTSLRRHDAMLLPLDRRQAGVSSSNPFSSGSNSFPKIGGNDNGGNGGSGSGTNTGTGSGSGSTGSGSSGSGSSSSGSSSDTFGSGYGAGSGNGNSGYGPDTSGLSSAAIAGIAVGSVLAFFLLVALLVWLCTRHRRRQQLQQKHNQEVLAKEMRAHRLSHSDETVAFAKVASGSCVQLADLAALPDDPPAYEESQRQGNANNGGRPLPLHKSSTADVEYAVGSVSDGFRQYIPPQPAHDAEGKADFHAPERRPDARQQF